MHSYPNPGSASEGNPGRIVPTFTIPFPRILQLTVNKPRGSAAYRPF